MIFSRKTRKLYYDHPTLFSTSTRVVKVVNHAIELEATIAYPEGGGQDSDIGTITRADGRVLRFVHAKTMYAHSPRLVEFPDIQVDGIVLHEVDPEDRALLSEVQPGEEVRIDIDVSRRFLNSLSHTASHLLYVAIGIQRPDLIGKTIGCHIKPEGARFDFATPERFTPSDLERIQALATELALQSLEVRVQAHPEVPDARVWLCGEYRIPCGGTHIASTRPIGPLKVRRKSLGSGKERISCEIPAADRTVDPVEFLSITGA